jgi:hypothetical protein
MFYLLLALLFQHLSSLCLCLCLAFILVLGHLLWYCLANGFFEVSVEALQMHPQLTGMECVS